MPAGRLVRIGNSQGLIIPKAQLQALGWWEADILHLEVLGEELKIRNLTQAKVRPIHHEADFGDAISRKT